MSAMMCAKSVVKTLVIIGGIDGGNDVGIIVGNSSDDMLYN